MQAIIPIPKIPINIRPATMEDLPFIDALQKKTTKQVGWMPTKQFEGKINAGHVLIAEEPPPQPSPGIPGEGEKTGDNSLLRYSGGGRGWGSVGYLIGNDQYFKRDDVGIIYQINIAESHRRSLVGAMLLKAQFDRSAYGCRLYCCWCAQDIEANYFWESMGFVPLAFRAGSEKKSRVHIFWQKRIRSGDETTPFWFPANTGGGAIREDRLVLPIPPGTHWRDVMPMILPKEEGGATVTKKISGPRAKGQSGKVQTPPPPIRRRAQFGPPPAEPLPAPATEPVAPAVKQKAPRKPRRKNDPTLIAAARELRDRWLEKVNEDPSLILPPGSSKAKYDVARAIAGETVEVAADIRALPQPLAA